MVCLQIDFPYSGPTGDDMAEAYKELAHAINNEKGIVWKIWTENVEAEESGGIYLFEDKESCNEYLEMHIKRLDSFGIKDVRAKVFDVNEKLSLLTKAPI
ncbi:monooxygenase [Sulfurimonas sp.]|nr:monooxygenase [Sulfurimonas sp.]